MGNPANARLELGTIRLGAGWDSEVVFLTSQRIGLSAKRQNRPNSGADPRRARQRVASANLIPGADRSVSATDGFGYAINFRGKQILVPPRTLPILRIGGAGRDHTSRALSRYAAAKTGSMNRIFVREGAIEVLHRNAASEPGTCVESVGFFSTFRDMSLKGEEEKGGGKGLCPIWNRTMSAASSGDAAHKKEDAPAHAWQV